MVSSSAAKRVSVNHGRYSRESSVEVKPDPQGQHEGILFTAGFAGRPSFTEPMEIMRAGERLKTVLGIDLATMVQGGGRPLAASSPMQEANKSLRVYLR